MDANELERIRPALLTLGYALEAEQPHISGERFLMQKEKLVLAGTDKIGNKVIIKVARLAGGKTEIKKEKSARDLLSSLAFASEVILFPKELHFGEIGEYLFLITEYIAQDKVFVEHTLEEQFFMALRAFEAQESFHATTFEHLKKVEKVFPVHHARDYFNMFEDFMKNTPSLEPAVEFLRANKILIDTYCNYLVHTDFVPHNLRVHGRKLYMLDAAAAEFGNKYEGWARFLNYMVIHNPALERLLSEYIQKNRGPEEYLNLRLMRVFKIGYLIDYYARSLTKTEGDLHELTQKRLAFWQRVLQSVLEDIPFPLEVVEEYKGKRDTLRSEEEKKRQKEFAVA